MMPTEKTIKLLEYLQEHPERASAVNWDKVKAESPDLKMDVVSKRFNLTQPAVGILEPEEPIGVGSVLRNVARSAGRLIDPETLSEGSRELIDTISQADPFTKKGAYELSDIVEGVRRPLLDWNMIIEYASKGLPRQLLKKMIGMQTEPPPPNVVRALRNIGLDPLAGLVTAGMTVGGAGALGRAGARAGMGARLLRSKVKGVKPTGIEVPAEPTFPAVKPKPTGKPEGKVVTGKKESIRSAAIKLPDGKIYEGKTHPDATAKLKGKDLNVSLEQMESGFVTTKGRFVGTEEAAKIARSSKQIKGDFKELDSYDFGKKGMPTPKKIPGELELRVQREISKPVVETPTEVATDVSVRNVMQALKEAKPVRKAQEALYSKERKARLAKLRAIGEKTTGEKGFFAEKGQLKGEFSKIEFETIREKISQTDIDNLFNKVKDADVLTEWERITAREGLSKMLGEHGGRVPTRGELILLEQVFPANFIETIMGKRPLLAKMKEAGLQLANIPRSVMASFDLSFGLRQGAFAAPKFRKAFWDSWKKQFKIFGSEKAYQASREALIAHKNFKLAKENKVSFTETGKILTQREESFQSQWAEKIPLVGRGVRASGRAYTAFANKYRLDMFTKLIEHYEARGLKPRGNPYLLRKTADFINNSTGRGSLGGFENSAVALNALFFSPRLNMARMRLLNPVYYIKQPKHLRKQALLTALGAAGTATTILTLAKLGGADVTADPRSADFGKIKIGNTRMDMLAGFGQFIRAGAQITTGQYISSSTGRKVTLGEGYRPLTRMDILIRQIESKESPVASFATELLRGKNWAGEDMNALKEAGRRFVPMVIADVIDIARDDPRLIPLGVPAFFGVGLMTYKPRRKKGFSGMSLRQ